MSSDRSARRCITSVDDRRCERGHPHTTLGLGLRAAIALPRHAPAVSIVAAARGPATCAATGAGSERQPGRDAHRAVCANRCSRRRAPRQPADRPGARAARPRAPSSPSIG
eukprot:scaffold28635_cov66-Phaeocystis_antarctica.AAC.2